MTSAYATEALCHLYVTSNHLKLYCTFIKFYTDRHALMHLHRFYALETICSGNNRAASQSIENLQDPKLSDNILLWFSSSCDDIVNDNICCNQ